MGVQDRLGISPRRVPDAVAAMLARDIHAVRRFFSASERDLDEVARRELAFATARTRDEHPVGRDARAEIPLGGDGHPAALENPARANQFVRERDPHRARARARGGVSDAAPDAPLRGLAAWIRGAAARRYGHGSASGAGMGASSAPLSRAMSAAGSASRISPAIIPRLPCRRAAISPARPWTKQPTAAASPGSIPCARSPAIVPVRISPAPAVAIPGFPVAFSTVGSPGTTTIMGTHLRQTI